MLACIDQNDIDGGVVTSPGFTWIATLCGLAAFSVLPAHTQGATSSHPAEPMIGRDESPRSRLAAAQGSLVYVKGSRLYVAHVNGTHPKVVLTRSDIYWPSMDDNGVIAVEATDGTTAPDGSDGYSIYRYSQSGKRLSRVSAPVDASTFGCPIYPSYHVAISPDGTKIAYDFFDCDETTSVWSLPRRLKFPHQGAGQEEYHAPTWIGDSQMLLTHVGVRVAGGKEAGIYQVADGQNSTSNWFSADSWATAFTASVTQSGKRYAILEDDGANYINGEPRHVSLILGSATGPGGKVTKRCTLSLPVKQYRYSYGVSNLGLSFAPNGKSLAWDSKSGIWRANTAKLTDCSTLNAQLWIKGAFNPSFSAGPDRL